MKSTGRFSLVILSLAALGPALACAPSDKKCVDVDGLIKEVVAARESQTKIKYVTDTYGTFSTEKAYKIQSALAERISKKLDPVVGDKVAYASKAARQQFGVEEPAAGPLFKSQRTKDGANCPPPSLKSPWRRKSPSPSASESTNPSRTSRN